MRWSQENADEWLREEAAKEILFDWRWHADQLAPFDELLPSYEDDVLTVIERAPAGTWQLCAAYLARS